MNLCAYLMMVVYKSALTCCNEYVMFVVLWYSDPLVDMNFKIICDCSYVIVCLRRLWCCVLQVFSFICICFLQGSRNMAPHLPRVSTGNQ